MVQTFFWFYISQKILEATDNFIPHKMSKGKCHLPRVSTSVKHLMKKCDRAYKKVRHSGKAVRLSKNTSDFAISLLNNSNSNLRNLPQMPPSRYECMPDIIFSTEGVKNQLLKIKIDRACGPDLTPARILRAPPQSSPSYSPHFFNNLTTQVLYHMLGS